jgi:hypothetical protein
MRHDALRSLAHLSHVPVCKTQNRTAATPFGSNDGPASAIVELQPLYQLHSGALSPGSAELRPSHSQTRSSDDAEAAGSGDTAAPPEQRRTISSTLRAYAAHSTPDSSQRELDEL